QFFIAFFGTFFCQVAGYLGGIGNWGTFLDVILGGGGVDQGGAGVIGLRLIGKVFHAWWNFTRGVVAAQQVVNTAQDCGDQRDDASDGEERLGLRLLLAQFLVQLLICGLLQLLALRLCCLLGLIGLLAGILAGLFQGLLRALTRRRSEERRVGKELTSECVEEQH